MRVDPSELRALAASMYEACDSIDEVDVRTPIDTSVDPLPGSKVFEALRIAGEFTEGAYLRMAERARRISAIAKGNEVAYSVTEEEFCARLAQIGTPR